MDSNGPLTYLEEWRELDKEFIQLEEEHKSYTKQIVEVRKLQKKVMSGIAHQRYRLKQITDSFKGKDEGMSAEMKVKIEEAEACITNRKLQFHEMEENLPHKNGLYLRIILGSVNVSLLSKEERYAYKQNYEQFKLVVTVITMIFSFCLLFFIHNSRWLDAGLHFLLVWYYCTMTIREHILIVNGSRIKGWWVTHHFISTVCAGLMLIWPYGETYQLFRKQFMLFTFCLSIVQIIQVYYQKGLLYKLRSLGERHTMDITVEGFQSWMWKGLSFVLPFLIFAYMFQIYNAYTLFQLWFHPRCKEWQVPFIAAIFFILFLGNSLTTSAVIRDKLRKDGFLNFKLLHKYRFNNWNKLSGTKVL
ncbi:transmembrane protein 120A-like [Tubulanus polymorphus]|uniref:transmembrane protein 120A-like n=1 Tax=Tubulanus polymorphus TaxID=672921 RepID=UPI003DA489FD